MPEKRKLLVVDLAALGWNLVSHLPDSARRRPFFPALTCTVQASFRTAPPPGAHGARRERAVFQRPAQGALLGAERDARRGAAHLGRLPRAGRQGGADVLAAELGGSGRSHRHAGADPQAQRRHDPELLHAAGRAGAAAERSDRPAVQSDELLGTARESQVERLDRGRDLRDDGHARVAPDLLLTYIPHLDYDLQRHGPASAEAGKALDVVLGYLTRLKAGVRGVRLRLAHRWRLRDRAGEARRGLSESRAAGGGALFHARHGGHGLHGFLHDAAFAVGDHRVAHVHCRDAASVAPARHVLRDLPGVAEVLDRAEQSARGWRTGAAANCSSWREGAWFAYPWFEKNEAPDYASHVDIHNKPGYDPCELFFGWPPVNPALKVAFAWPPVSIEMEGTVSMDTTKIRGTHGSTRPGMEIAWASSLAVSRGAEVAARSRAAGATMDGPMNISQQEIRETRETRQRSCGGSRSAGFRPSLKVCTVACFFRVFRVFRGSLTFPV